MLVRSSRARSIVEFGASFGISTLHLAAGLRDNGAGHIITTEFEPSKAARARANFVEGGVVRSSEGGYTSVPFAGDVELSMYGGLSSASVVTGPGS